MLNRQFVLDVLRRGVDSIEWMHGDQLLRIPLIGRYKRNHEIGPELKIWLERLNDVESILRNKRIKTYRSIRKKLSGVDEPFPDEPYYKITDEKRESNLSMVHRLKSGLEKEIEFLERYVDENVDRKNNLDVISRFSDKQIQGFSEHFKDAFPGYHGYFDDSSRMVGFNWYRDEAVWGPIHVDEGDKRVLEGIKQGFSSVYPSWFND